MSWVIVRRETGEAVAETFSRRVAEAVNLDRYRVVPIREWLAGLTRRAPDAGGGR